MGQGNTQLVFSEKGKESIEVLMAVVSGRIRPIRRWPTFPLLIISIVLLFGCGGEPLKSSASEPPRKTDNGPTHSSSRDIVTDRPLIADVAFKNTSFVWATNIQGTKLYRTVDGGEGFQTVATPFRQKTCISFLDAKNGWAITESTDRGRLWRTQDGGGTWKQISEFDQSNSDFQLTSVKQLDFVDARSGWLVDLFGAWRTIDGGEHWTPVFKLENQPSAGQAVHAAFLDSERARIATTKGIYLSNNGGP